MEVSSGLESCDGIKTQDLSTVQHIPPSPISAYRPEGNESKRRNPDPLRLYSPLLSTCYLLPAFDVGRTVSHGWRYQRRDARCPRETFDSSNRLDHPRRYLCDFHASRPRVVDDQRVQAEDHCQATNGIKQAIKVHRESLSTSPAAPRTFQPEIKY